MESSGFTKVNRQKNRVKKYTNNYYTKDYNETFNIYKNDCEEDKESRLYINSVNMSIFWGMTKMSNDWKLNLLMKNGITEKTDMKSIVDWSSVYYVKHIDTFMNYTELFDYCCSNNGFGNDISIFDIHLEIMDLLKCNNVIDINCRSYSELEIVKDWENYETFLMWLVDNNNESGVNIKMSSVSWWRFYTDWCNEDNEDYLKNKLLLDKFIKVEQSEDRKKKFYKFKYNKLKDFGLF